MEDFTVRRKKTAMQGREAGRDGGDRSYRRRDGNTTKQYRFSSFEEFFTKEKCAPVNCMTRHIERFESGVNGRCKTDVKTRQAISQFAPRVRLSL